MFRDFLFVRIGTEVGIKFKTKSISNEEQTNNSFLSVKFLRSLCGESDRSPVPFSALSVHCRECDKLFQAVGLDIGVVGGAVSVYLTAFCTAVYYNIALAWIGDGGNRLHKSAALVCTVSGIYIDMYRPKTVRAMVARAFSERLHLPAAVLADKSAVIFAESFYFHKYIPRFLRGKMIITHFDKKYKLNKERR